MARLRAVLNPRPRVEASNLKRDEVDLAVATELNRSGGAVARAESWVPPHNLPAERRSHYYIELAGAQLDIGLWEDSYKSLELARQIAPQHTREHPRVRRSLAQMMGNHPSPSTEMRAMAAWARAHEPPN